MYRGRLGISLYRKTIILYEGSTPPLALKNYLPTPPTHCIKHSFSQASSLIVQSSLCYSVNRLRVILLIKIN
nr:MAG TPA: hypothetical protein [Caudoviricetes sp.]